MLFKDFFGKLCHVNGLESSIFLSQVLHISPYNSPKKMRPLQLKLSSDHLSVIKSVIKKAESYHSAFSVLRLYWASISRSRIKPSCVVLHTNSPFCHIRPKFKPRELALTVASMSYNIKSSTRKGLWKYMA
ncbi:hypothetical protein F946_00133 [Acinetobacter johnsonii ANC 3681]|uniref:Uncharacterized protein n=1 Tax=Acinetobacter johnsonii ANC 3681 TaxID=1217662 RepID=N9CUC7_ACIJO|nr:hypothetical protein F946_00133 [Acinetobacter johnsonii ANC 3681]